MTSSPSSSSTLLWASSPCSSSPPSYTSPYVALSPPRLTLEGTSSRFLTIIAPNILECFGSLDEGNFICRILNVYRELFTLLGDARVNRFHIWAVSQSLLLAIFSMRPIVHCSVRPSMCTVFHKECVKCQTSIKTGSAH